MPAGKLSIVSGRYAPSPRAFLSPLPTLFAADESGEEREAPLRDADQAGVPERRAQSQGNLPSVRGPGQRLLLQLVPSTSASRYRAPKSPSLPRQNSIFTPSIASFPPVSHPGEETSYPSSLPCVAPVAQAVPGQELVFSFLIMSLGRGTFTCWAGFGPGSVSLGMRPLFPCPSPPPV